MQRHQAKGGGYGMKMKASRTIQFLADTALEKACVAGIESLEDIKKLTEMALDINCFWQADYTDEQIAKLFRGAVEVANGK